MRNVGMGGIIKKNPIILNIINKVRHPGNRSRTSVSARSQLPESRNKPHIGARLKIYIS